MTGLRGVLRGDKLMSREGSMGEVSSGQARLLKATHPLSVHPSQRFLTCSLDVSCRRCTIFTLQSKQRLVLITNIMIIRESHSGYCIFTTQKNPSTSPGC
jgi:hypothetical protein